MSFLNFLSLNLICGGDNNNTYLRRLLISCYEQSLVHSKFSISVGYCYMQYDRWFCVVENSYGSLVIMSDSCDPMDCSLPDSSVHGILQARILEWVAMISYPRGSCWPRDWTLVSCISCPDKRILYHCTSWETHAYTLGTSNSWAKYYCYLHITQKWKLRL